MSHSHRFTIESLSSFQTSIYSGKVIRAVPLPVCEIQMMFQPTLLSIPDVDECAAGLAVCPRFRKCLNTFGSYICKCHDGFDLQYINGKYQCIGDDLLHTPAQCPLTFRPVWVWAGLGCCGGVVVSAEGSAGAVLTLWRRELWRERRGTRIQRIKSKCIWIALFTRNVTEGFTYAHTIST